VIRDAAPDPLRYPLKDHQHPIRYQEMPEHRCYAEDDETRRREGHYSSPKRPDGSASYYDESIQVIDV